MKKILFLTIFTILLFGIWQTCFAVDLLLDYPDVPGAQKLSEASDLPNIINYIYKFALLACGITAFISILFGAIQYVTSAGDSSKAGDAKKRITDALWGILILLSAVLILRTINPDLVNLTGPNLSTNSNNSDNNWYCNGRCVVSGVYGPWTCNALENTITTQQEAQLVCYNLIMKECAGYQFSALAKTESCPIK